MTEGPLFTNNTPPKKNSTDEYLIATHRGNAIVFTKEQALEAFAQMPWAAMCLCVDVPRCLWVACAADAVKFYENKEQAHYPPGHPMWHTNYQRSKS